MYRVHAAVGILILFFHPSPSFPAPQEDSISGQKAGVPVLRGVGPFPLMTSMEKRVRFWVEIYAKYSSWETVLHDMKNPEIQFSVVNTMGAGSAKVSAEKSKLLRLLGALDKKSKKANGKPLAREKLKFEEKELYDKLLAMGLENKIHEYVIPGRIRGQAGLRDNLLDALFISGRYLPRMERVFAAFGLPEEIAYLPFVESGFNKRAVSKVGASGIWQFMPYTGKIFLRVDDVVDERNDPMRAAEAAARLMRQNYDILGDWPLAITAYNHGAMGVSRAAKEVGTKSLDVIIEKYEGKNFGFASENFYASFLAALHVAQNSEMYLGLVPRARKLEFDEFVMPHYMEFRTFVERTGIEEAEFRELNPALTSEVYAGKKMMPVGYTVRIPIDARDEFLSRYERIPAGLKFGEQRKPASLEPVPFSDRNTESFQDEMQLYRDHQPGQ